MREAIIDMITQSLDRYIEITPDISGGKPRIAGHRITVQDVVMWHERIGRSADEIATEYDLSLASIYAALAYYYDNRSEIDKNMQERQVFVESLRKQTPSLIQQKLNAC
jgi:uncharacterized protein (DUF433 family)